MSSLTVVMGECRCRTQEVLVCLALLSDAPWRSRLSHIFDIFKSTCTNEIYSEDIMLGLEVVLEACLSLWDAELKVETDRDELRTVTEEISVAALDKVCSVWLLLVTCMAIISAKQHSSYPSLNFLSGHMLDLKRLIMCLRWLW